MSKDTDLESQADFASHQFFHSTEHDRVAYFFSLTVSFNFAIQSRRLTGLGVSIIRPYCVNLRDANI